MEELSTQKIKNLVNNSLMFVGRKQVLKAIIFSPDRVECVLLARDAQADLTEPIMDLCKQKNLKFYFIESKKELGKLAGIDVNASTLAVLNKKAF
jgi:large subunit ribosomal protein L7A